MSRRIVSITLDNLSDLPTRCRACVFWELDPAVAEQARNTGAGALEKEAWISDTLLEWGSCGQLAYVNGLPAGYVLYAPAAYVPRAMAFPTSPVSADALLVMSARIDPAHAGGGLGRVLIQSVAREAVRHGVRAVEAFGRAGAVPRNEQAPDGTSLGCLLPAGYLRAVGFKTVRAHPRVPRLRLDIRTTVTWRADVESALERLLGTIQSPIPSR